MKRIPYGVLLSLLLLFPLGIQADPEGDIGEKLRQVEELTRLLEQARAAAGEGGVAFEEQGNTMLRVYNVADLTVRLTNYIAPHMELKPAGAEIDEAQPMFGKAEEGEIFFANIDELIDLIYNNVNPEAWWQVDLEEPAELARVVLIFYYGDQREYEFYIETSLDGQTWDLAADYRGNPQRAAPEGTAVSFTPRTARYLRVTQTHNSANTGRHLVEVLAYGRE